MVRDLRTMLAIIIMTLIVGASLIFANAPTGPLINDFYLVGRHIVPPPTDTPTSTCDCGRHADLKSSR